MNPIENARISKILIESTKWLLKNPSRQSQECKGILLLLLLGFVLFFFLTEKAV